jgi:antirestriction protein ArdC
MFDRIPNLVQRAAYLHTPTRSNTKSDFSTLRVVELWSLELPSIPLSSGWLTYGLRLPMNGIIPNLVQHAAYLYPPNMAEYK